MAGPFLALYFLRWPRLAGNAMHRSGVRPSVRLSHLFITLIGRAAHSELDS